MCLDKKKRKTQEPAITLCFPNQEAMHPRHVEDMTCRLGVKHPGSFMSGSALTAGDKARR